MAEGDETAELAANLQRATAQLTTVEGERDAAAKQHADEVAAHEATRATVATQESELATARRRIEDLEAAAARVPTGAAGRTVVDTSSMTPAEKIRHGLANRGG